VIKALLECDLLILDDIGAEKVTDWGEETLFNIIDDRDRKEFPIFYTSILQPKELLDKLGKRSYDRMIETRVMIENKAMSYRRAIAKERMKRFGQAV
jgi:DNA replication protein DnaC